MYSLALLAFSSFALAFLLTPLCRDLSWRLGWLDQPDEGRKLHAGPVPRIGGVPLMLAYLGAFAILLVSPLSAGALVRGHLGTIGKLAPAALLVFATGVLDDLIGLRPWQKLTGQLGAAGLAYGAGVCIHSIGGVAADGWCFPLTILWLVGCTNAFNLIDGVDGLAAGIGLFATLTSFLAALLHNDLALALATVPLAGALAGFLRYNFNPATIFLGDCGSLTVGFLLGCYGVLWSQKSATLLGMTAPLMALAIPLLDTVLAIGRRLLCGQPVFTADRGHIHHHLLDLGLTPRRVAMLLYGASGVAAGLSLIESVAHGQFTGLAIVLFCAAAWVGVQHLGYVEFTIARRLVAQRTFQRIVKAQLSLRDLERALAAAPSLAKCWEPLREGCRELGFRHVRLRAASQIFSLEDTPGSAEDGKLWYVHVPLPGANYVELGGAFDAALHPAAVGPLADMLRRELGRHCTQATPHEPLRLPDILLQKESKAPVDEPQTSRAAG